MTNTKPSLIFLMGPTASGKTALAAYLHQQYPVEIISVDSALIYRGMDIGTAKPTQDELQITPHFLINIREPSEVYSAAHFRRDALNCIAEIIDRGHIPLLVGGTMLYFKALFEGLSPLPEASLEVRKLIEQRAINEGWNTLHTELKQYDPTAAERIHPNDPQRLIRALEILMLSGKSMTELTQVSGQALPYNVLQFALSPLDRSELHQRIAERFMTMLEQGFQSEVQHLMQDPLLHAELPSMRSVGYRQMWQYLKDEITEEEMIFKAIAATRQLAKRQLTWLRGWSDLQWITHDNYQAIDRAIQKILL